MTNEDLLAAIETVIRDMPPLATIRHPTEENHSWFGRATALIAEWDYLRAPFWNIELDRVTSGRGRDAIAAIDRMRIMLYEARSSIQQRIGRPMGVSVAKGDVFHYFDELRKVIESAKVDLFFVDRYLDAEFVSRYLPFVTLGVVVRLMAREGIPKLKPAVDAFVLQHGSRILVRSTQDIHERYVFVDGAMCYFSGDSFRDGARAQPVTLHLITDTFAEVQAKYEAIWGSAAVERA